MARQIEMIDLGKEMKLNKDEIQVCVENEKSTALTIVTTTWSKFPIGFRRGIGLLFDELCLMALWSLPMYIHGLDFAAVAHGGLNTFLNSQFDGALFLMQSIGTPIPLMSLRFFCKVVMRMRTPGEVVAGYSCISERPGASSLFRQLTFAFAQYVCLGISLAAAALVAAVVTMIVMVFPRLASIIVSLGEIPEIIVCATLVLAPYLITLGSLFKQTDGQLESRVDKLCKVSVVPSVIAITPRRGTT